MKQTMIFHYGDSNPAILAMKLGTSRSDILSRSVPAVIVNYELVFAGKSKQYSQKSIATLMPASKMIVRGFCTTHTMREIQILDTFNGYPLTFDRIKIRAHEVTKTNDVLKKQLVCTSLVNEQK
mmetsp:Transcript_16765/g.16033  ORF Transcript_16765/g.16033 Transcript_16765/m.16033 type:complete len:124 (+) Transcript_16765:55-426(+)